MQSIAALGPSHTISEIAAKAWMKQQKQQFDLKLFTTYKGISRALSSECDYGIIPIENMILGHIQPNLDLLLNHNFHIIDEILIPVQFSLASNCSDISKIDTVYAQFVTQEQCSDFLESLPDIKLITTESNRTSIDVLQKGAETEAAIVPSYILDELSFTTVVDNVADNSFNLTRFLVISKKEMRLESFRSFKTSIVIIEGSDQPGTLRDILDAFSKRKLNLVSIISRPNKETLGKYHFFVDIDADSESVLMKEAFKEIQKYGEIKILGSYPVADTPKPDIKKPAIDLNSSPFGPPKDRPEVFVSHGSDAYSLTVEAIKSIDLGHIKNKKVLLKPNVGRIAEKGSGIVTNSQVVAAAIDVFREAGADVAVGESPVAGVNLAKAYEKCGITEIAEKRECPLVDMDKRKPVIVPVEGVAIDSLKVCADVFDYDIIVSIPVAKMHMHTGVTLSLKNMKGCLWRRSKVDLHMLPLIEGQSDKPLNIAIADMSTVLYPHLAIIDGTIGLEGLGPSAGDPKDFGVVVVSTDALAADAVACELMGVNPENVPHLRIGQERGLGTLNVEDISVRPSNWRDFISPFADVPENISIDFPNVNILDMNSCSACQSTVLLFLKRYGDTIHEYFPDGKEINIAIGKGHNDVPEGTVCVGNCVRIHQDKGIFIKGCPPVASAILEEIKNNS